MARSITDICNEAIGDLPAHPITSINDNSKEARECSRYLPGIVSELINYHDFDFVEKRVSLAEVDNDRPGEWARAYRLPNQIISPISLIPDYESQANLAIATGQVGAGENAGPVVVTPVLYYRNSRLDLEPIDYEVANQILYTDLPTPILTYSTDALEPHKWTPLFAKAIICALASRIYRPLLGERADTRELAYKNEMAMAAMYEAVADDMNRNPRRRKDFISDGEAARHGDYGTYGSYGNRWSL